MNSIIDPTAKVINGTLGEDSHIWANARVHDSKIGDYSSIGEDSIVHKSNIDCKCEIGRRNIISNSQIGKGSSTQSNTTIRYSKIGRFCAIAWNVTIGAPNHEMRTLALAEHNYIFSDCDRMPMRSFKEKECLVCNDVWIGAGAHVLRGVTISDGVVVGANAVVTKDVPPYAIVAGVPAKIIGYRFNKEIRERLLKLKWWNLPQDVLNQIKESFSDEFTLEKLDELEIIISGYEL